MPQKIPPLHPGEVLREEFLVPLNLSPDALAKAMGVPRTRVERIAAETGAAGSGRIRSGADKRCVRPPPGVHPPQPFPVILRCEHA